MAGRKALAAGLGADAALSEIATRLAAHQLEILGGFHTDADAALPVGTTTLLLIGPKEPGFWQHLTAQPEWDGAPDPVDRWSRRVIGQLACDIGAKALFPFGGPPYHPFYQWALRTGRVWDSPVRLLVHADQGLMVSFRGALALKEHITVPPAATKPCADCAAPCLAACPAGALGETGYDVPACRAYLSAGDRDCMKAGCLVRRACPVTQAYARMPEQSAYHMRQFHK
jgi:epoxyqueuosine reductase